MAPAPDARRDQVEQAQLRRRSPPAAVQALIDAYEDGSSPEQIASGLRLTASDVRKILRDHGTQLRAQDTPRTPAAARVPPPPPTHQVPPLAEKAGDKVVNGTQGDLGENDPRAYIQIAWRVARKIEDGTLAAGSPAPSITTLVQETGRTRVTCGKALRRLENLGLLIRYPGLGYYVTSRARHQSSALPAAGSPVSENQETAQAARPQVPSVPLPGHGAGRRDQVPPSTAADEPDRPPRAIFRSPEPSPQPASTVLPATPGQHTEPEPGIPLENIFELPGAWPPGEDHLCWLVTPVSAPAADAAQALALHYQNLTRTGGLTPVPPRWLHVTVGHAGPDSELSAREQARLVSIVRDRAGQLPAFTLTTTGPAEITPRGIACRVMPPTPLRQLENLTATAFKATGHHSPAPPAVIQDPHLVLAYATCHATISPPAQQPAVPAARVSIRVSELRLVKARHDGSQLTWRPVETIPLGAPRTRKPRSANPAAPTTI